MTSGTRSRLVSRPFIEQPLRLEQSKRGHRLPLHALNPPKGPGKENFLLRLQPVFAAGEAVFCGERQQFRKLIDELLGFPYGLKDTINALAYMLEIKPGEPVYSQFRNAHVTDGFQPSRGRQMYLLLHSDTGGWSGAILVETGDQRLLVLADWCEQGGLAEVVPAAIQSARAKAGRADLVAYCPPIHFKAFDRVGLRPAAASAGVSLLQGGDTTLGQAEIRRLLQNQIVMGDGAQPLLQVSREAAWTIRAMSGGYARAPNAIDAIPGPYKVIGEALESFAAFVNLKLAPSALSCETPDSEENICHRWST
jgi:hypothetical protein